MRDVIDVRRWWVALLPVAFAAMLIVSTRPAMSAASSVVVTMNVPSAITLTNGCTQQPAWGLGVVQPGSIATTATGANVCRFDFASSNDSAQLRIGQSDGTGTAMTGAPNTVSQGSDVSGHFSITAADASTAYVSWPMGKSSDSGASWSGAGLTSGPTNITAASDQLLYGNSWMDNIARSEDGATSPWTNLTNPHAGSWTDIIPARGTNAVWIHTGNEISWSGDKGDNWTDRTAAVALAGVTGIDDLVTLSATDAVLLGHDGSSNYLVLITTDSGLSWTPTVFAPTGSYWSGSIEALSTSVIWLRNSDNRFQRTINGGATAWTAPSTPPLRSPGTQTSDLDFVAIDSMTALFTDGARLLLRTTDGAATWLRVDLPTGNAIRGFDRLLGGTIVASGSRRQILRSTDDGASWALVSAGSPQMLGIAAIDANTAYAAGSRGTVRRTTDGSTWATVSATGSFPTLWDISMATSTAGIAVGNAGTVVRTSNGTTWNAATSGLPSTVRLNGVSVRGSNAVAVGSSGTIIRSTDQGASWSSVPSGTTQMLWDIEFAPEDPSVVWAVGAGDTVIRSTNGGATWAAAMPPGYGSDAVFYVAAVSANVAWVASGNYLAYRTIDGGASWTPWPVSWAVFGLDAYDAQHAVVSGWDNVWITHDGGATSEQVPAGGMSGPFDGVDMNTGWLVSGDTEFAKLMPGASVPDFGGAPNNWAGGPADGLFAMCVQDVGLSGAITAPFVEDSVSTPGSCQAAAADPWAAIPTTSAKLATTSSAGQAGRVDLVWAMRAPSSQAPGDYSAAITIEAIAPNA